MSWVFQKVFPVIKKLAVSGRWISVNHNIVSELRKTEAEIDGIEYQMRISGSTGFEPGASKRPFIQSRIKKANAFTFRRWLYRYFFQENHSLLKILTIFSLAYLPFYLYTHPLFSFFEPSLSTILAQASSLSMAALLLYGYIKDRRLFLLQFERLDNLCIKASKLQQAIEEDIIENIIIPLIHENIKKFDCADYLILGGYQNGHALSEMADAGLIVQTRAIGELKSILARMNGGNLGIAGPRGVGKTTLIRSFCQDETLIAQMETELHTRIFSVILSVPVEYDSRDFILQVFSAICRKILQECGLGDGWAEPGHWKWNHTLMQIFGTITPAFFYHQLTTSPFTNETCILAQRLLQEIRYQQSFSGSLNSSFKTAGGGVTAGSQITTSLSRYPMSLPEVVESYTYLLKTLTTLEHRQVIIGIDELDKITSIEKARAFLNEIKAIFGIPNCFYLVSVSDNAMSNFERRGLPFRDEFDSAFDEVLFVDYLDYETSQSLIKRRVTGLPNVFIDFAYVLSGGLPRDLIRYSRAIVTYAQAHPGKINFDEVCRNVLTQDIVGKLRATKIILADQEISLKYYEFFRYISDFETQTSNMDFLRASPLELHKLLNQVEKLQPTLEPVDSTYPLFSRLVYDLMAFVCFSLAVFDFFLPEDFTNRRHSVDEAARKSAITSLAKCQQAFSINSRHAIGSINHFRVSLGLGRHLDVQPKSQTIIPPDYDI